MHVHDQGDEILYVVAGEGTINIGNTPSNLAPAFVSVVPKGTAHSISRRGRNPLILVSVVAGAPCTTAPTTTVSR
jgi:mannose-6-phosphate isomerase-like protein (cupin superfamily)